MKKLLSIVLALSMLCGMVSLASAEGYDYAGTIDWYGEPYDVVVIGLGLAGATSAITAADLGAKVLVTEKAPEGHEGGNSKYAGQVIISPEESSHDEFIYYYTQLQNNYPDAASPEMIEALFQKACKNEQWLKDRFADLGKEPDIRPFGAGGSWSEWPELPGAFEATRIFSPGQAFSGCLFYLAEDNVFARKDKIDVWFESPAKHLIQDPFTKEILGVQIEKEGQLVNVRANAGVIMCCGGFQANHEMMANYLHAPYTTNQGGEYNTGDGVNMAIEVGAQLWHMNNAAGFTWAFEVPGTERSAGMGTGSPSNGILVGMDGTRFLSETAANRHGKVQIGGRWITMPTSERNYVIMDDAKVSTTKLGRIFSDGNKEEIEKGWIIKADTLEELAEKLDIPAENLKATVDTWNGYVDAGVDPQFGRNMENAPKIQQAPFYAMQIKPTQYNTQGGAKRNEKAEVLDTNGNPIPHLFSAGEFGSMYADKYNGGSNLMECVCYGQIAAESAVKNLQ